MIDLDTLPGQNSVATAINDRGQIVGCRTDDHAPYGESSETFVWQNGKMTGLGTLRGGKKSAAVALNEHNQIIGWSTTKTGRRHAVLWTLKPGS